MIIIATVTRDLGSVFEMATSIFIRTAEQLTLTEENAIIVYNSNADVLHNCTSYRPTMFTPRTLVAAYLRSK